VTIGVCCVTWVDAQAASTHKAIIETGLMLLKGLIGSDATDNQAFRLSQVDKLSLRLNSLCCGFFGQIRTKCDDSLAAASLAELG
jgi:hypothetical protein